MVNHFGDRIRQLRESNNLLQRHIAAQLDMDTPMLSKIERGERRAKKLFITQLAKIFNADEKELLTLWLADQLYDVAKDEDVALSALHVTEKSIRVYKKSFKNI